MSVIPRDWSIDSTLALLNEGYRFISDRSRWLRTDVFQTRLLLSPVICMTGAEAAEVFYHTDRFTRRHAMPITALLSLQDRDSVQQLDGDAHRHRKQMFMSLMTRDSILKLAAAADTEWRKAIERWEDGRPVTVLDEAHEIFCRAAFAWSGIPAGEWQSRARAEEFAAMIDGAGSFGPRNWRGLTLRSRTEAWLRRVIDCARLRRDAVANDTPLAAVLDHRDLEGNPLDTSTAAVELLNFLRPTVAIARYAMFAGLAIFRFPRPASHIADGLYDLWFAQEIRRLAPFFPFVGGRVRDPFEWHGYRFRPRQWVLLDLFGTNRDPRIWEDPETFAPERFREWNGDPYRLIPQGGGSHFTGHRCAGEWITIELLRRSVRHLASIDFHVPDQDLRVHLSRIPAEPRSRLIIERVRRRRDWIDAEAADTRQSVQHD